MPKAAGAAALLIVCAFAPVAVSLQNTALEPASVTVEETFADALATRLKEDFVRSCPADDTSVYLRIIAEDTAGVDLEVVSQALRLLLLDEQLCAAARAAVSEASNLAAFSLASTSAIDTDDPTRPFTFGGIIVPGGAGYL